MVALCDGESLLGGRSCLCPYSSRLLKGFSLLQYFLMASSISPVPWFPILQLIRTGLLPLTSFLTCYSNHQITSPTPQPTSPILPNPPLSPTLQSLQHSSKLSTPTPQKGSSSICVPGYLGSPARRVPEK